ncbi:MAG: AAA family ATPase [Isosphaeraceae bacterium]
MITRFQVKNYKLLKDVDVPLTPIHVIVGQNDSGKTTFLEALRAFCRTAEDGVSSNQAFGDSSSLHELVSFGATEPVVNFLADIDVKTKNIQFRETYELKLRIPSPPQALVIVLNEGLSSGQVRFSAGPRSTTGVSTRKQLGPDNPAREDLEGIADALLPVNLYLFDPRAMASPAAYDANRKFRMDENGFGLSTLLDDILGFDAKRFLDLSSEFSEYFPEFQRIRLETVELAPRTFARGNHSESQGGHGKEVVLESSIGESIRARQASDGVLLFLGFLALLYSPKAPRILLIEEPERGVYPKRLAEIIGILKRLVEPTPGRVTPQIILTTHSPYLLSFFQPEEVTLMSRRGDHAIARPLRNAPHIHERMGEGGFYLGELWYNLEEAELFGDAEVAGVD